MTELAFRYSEIELATDTPVKKFNPHIDKLRRKIMIDSVKFTPHCLRHTYATLLYSAGVDLLTAKAMFGHADVTVLLDIYTHLDNTKKIKSIDNLNTYLSRGQDRGQTL